MKLPVELTGSAADRECEVSKISASRCAMQGGHMKSEVPLDHPEPSEFFTGADVNYHDYVFNDVADEAGTICTYNYNGVQRRAVFNRFGCIGDSTPLETVMFFRRSEKSENMKNKTVIDIYVINHYTNHDNVFSSTKYSTDKLRALMRGETNQINKGDMLTTMPCLVEGEFADGVSLPTVTMSHPDVIEDAYTISEWAAQKLHASGIRIIIRNLREDEYLLDTYGYDRPDGTHVPRYFPSVGQPIRNDGLVIATRRHDPLFGAMDSSVGECQHPSPWYDHCEYVDADPEHYKNPTDDNGSRVIDIQVLRDETRCGNGENNLPCSEENKRILDTYAMAQKKFYQDIFHFYFSVCNEDAIWAPRATLFLSNVFASETAALYPEHKEDILRVVNDAVRRGEYNRETIERKVLSRLSSPVERSLRDPIRTYMIKIVVRYPIPVTVSSKITDRSGTKGIVGNVLPVEKMPINEFGQRVHVLRSMNAVPRRSTYSAIFYIYWSAASEQLKIRLKPMLDEGKHEEVWEIMMDYVARYNPDWANCLNATHDTLERKKELIQEIYDYRLRMWKPHEIERSSIEISESLGEYAPKKSKLLITNYDGVQEWTKNEFYVGNVETLRLDKTGREFSCQSAMYLNCLGSVDASNQGRGTYPIVYKSLKWGAEPERRLCEAYGPGNFDEVHNRANAPDVHEQIVEGLYSSPTPTNPGYLVDRTKYPLGQSQIDKMIRNIHRCEGFELVRPVREDNEE